MKQIYTFLIRLTLCWLIVMPLWLFLTSPHYGELLTTAANALVGTTIANNDAVRYEYVHPCVKGNIQFDVTGRHDGRMARGDLRFAMDGERYHFNVTIWIALVLATPFERRRSKQIVLLLGGWVALLLLQVLHLYLETADCKLIYMIGREFQATFQPPDMGDYFLAYLGRYFLLVGYIVGPLLLWLPFGIPRLRRRASANHILSKTNKQFVGSQK